MFLFALILIGITLITPAYLQENSKSFLVAAVKDASAQASSYVNLGVVNLDDDRYSPLNDIIVNYTRYRTLDLKFIDGGILSENTTRITVAVKFVETPSNRSVDGPLAEAIGRFLQRYLGSVEGFKLVEDGESGYHLYYHGKLVEFLVYVNGERRVVS